MYLSELTPVVDELRARVGERFSGAWQPRRDRVVVGIGDAHVLMVPRGPLARVHEVRRRPANPQRPFSFQGALRAHVAGRLRAVTGGDADRIVTFTFDRGAIHLRLTGRGGGLWILDDGVVVAAYDGPAPERLPPIPDRAPLGRAPRFAPAPDERHNDAAARFFAGAERSRELDLLRADVGRRLRRRRERLTRLQDALCRDLDRAMEAPALRRRADALAAVLHTVGRGDRVVLAPDLLDAGLLHEIVLDPRRSPGQTLTRLYDRAKRLEDQGLEVMARLDRVAAALAAVTDAEARVPEASAEALAELGALAPPSTARSRAGRVDHVVWRGPGGREVWVGRDARSNRALTFQHARGRDWWMHLRDRPGAHLILPVRSGRSPDLPWLLAAGAIALHHAGVAVGTSHEVQYAPVKHIRAIPGDAHGRVRVLQEKVLLVTRLSSPPEGWTRDP